MSAMELVDYGFIILCIYRPPDSNFKMYLKMLESIMQKTQSINKKILVWGLELQTLWWKIRGHKK
jgi:hypothetical protein